MKASHITASLALAGSALALDMSLYAPSSAVETGFRPFLQQLYLFAEDPATTDTFTNFFTPQGKLIVRGITATGASEIIALKQRLLPTAGNKHWNHRPNATTVDSETAQSKTYQVLGVIESTYDGGNCSQAYYSSRFTVTKDAGGAPQLTPHSGSLVTYDDFIVQPSTSPTDIPCGTV